MGIFLDETARLREAGQGLRRSAWPRGRYLRLVSKGSDFGYQLIEDSGFEEFTLGSWRPSPSDLAACDWYLDEAYTI